MFSPRGEGGYNPPAQLVHAYYIKLWENGVLRVSYSGHTSVAATVNLGGFTSGQKAYLFVFNPEEPRQFGLHYIRHPVNRGMGKESRSQGSK